MRLGSPTAGRRCGGRARILTAILMSLLACRPAPTPESGSPEDPAAESIALESLPSRAEFVSGGLAFKPESRDQLRARFGPPDSVSREAVPNRHVAGVLDTIYTVHYPDLVARIHHPGGGGDLMSMVQVASNRHLRFPILGLSLNRIDSVFGRPDEASDSSIVYYCATCEAGNDPVEIVFADGEARRVRFNYYVD